MLQIRNRPLGPSPVYLMMSPADKHDISLIAVIDVMTKCLIDRNAGNKTRLYRYQRFHGVLTRMERSYEGTLPVEMGDQVQRFNKLVSADIDSVLKLRNHCGTPGYLSASEAYDVVLLDTMEMLINRVKQRNAGGRRSGGILRLLYLLECIAESYVGALPDAMINKADNFNRMICADLAALSGFLGV